MTKKQQVLEAATQLAKAEIGPDADGLAWVCEQIADGRTFTEIAVALSSNRSTVSRVFHDAAPDAKARIREARRDGATALVEQALAICDSASTLSTAAVQKARLQSETRITLAAAWDRETYSTRAVEIQVSLGDMHLEALLRTREVGQQRPQQLEPLPDVEVLPASDNTTAPLALISAGSEE